VIAFSSPSCTLPFELETSPALLVGRVGTERSLLLRLAPAKLLELQGHAFFLPVRMRVRTELPGSCERFELVGSELTLDVSRDRIPMIAIKGPRLVAAVGGKTG
jgi:hypothetical protein